MGSRTHEQGSRTVVGRVCLCLEMQRPRKVLVRVKGAGGMWQSGSQPYALAYLATFHVYCVDSVSIVFSVTTGRAHNTPHTHTHAHTHTQETREVNALAYLEQEKASPMYDL